MNKLLLLLCVFPTLLFSQSHEMFNEITKADEGLYFMYYDSSNSKSAIVEFKDFIVLIEVPIKDQGGGARNLIDHTEGAEKVLATLNNYFPEKPLKYVLSSHWHPHSISAVKPFISKGITLVTTEQNFEKLKEFVEQATIESYGKYIYFVKDDSLVISDEVNRIIAYRFEQKDYPSTPTKDYLYFYLPEYNNFHCGCMYNKWQGDPVYGKEILTGREEDLHKFITSKNLNPASMIRLDKEKDQMTDMIEFEKLANVVTTGIRSTDILNTYLNIDKVILAEKKDSIVKELLINNIPPSIINSCVYRMLDSNDLSKALNYAKIQAMLNPSDANAWDTLGEVYFFLGDLEFADLYERQSKKINPSSNGGRIVWEEDLKNYKAKWEQKR